MQMSQSALLNKILLAVALVCLHAGALHAENSATEPLAKPIERFFPKSYAGGFFSEKYKEVIEVKESQESDSEDSGVEEVPSRNEIPGIEFQTSDISKKTFLPPDQTPSVAVNPNAPSSIISMIESNRRGDKVTARAYAKQFVRMLQNFFFEAREMTSLIGDALIEESVIENEDWIGAEQAIDIELAKTRLEKGVSIKPTHDVAMKRIVPDPKKEVEVFFIFSRACSYCRHMAPDVERVQRTLASDKRVKITGLVVGEADEAWLREFREYTGLSIPVFDGTEFAKNFKLKFFPIMMVLLPNGERSYYKSGQQTFERMYEFVRTAQGVRVEDSPALQAIIKTPIGQAEQLILASSKDAGTVSSTKYGARPVRMPLAPKKGVEVDKF